MRIFVWHGYLLAGTGSNIYARQLSREWSREGHDVTVFSQEAHPERVDLGGATAVKPDVGGLLPVFVLDRYEGLNSKLLQDFTPDERTRYVEANAAALRDLLPADVVGHLRSLQDDVRPFPARLLAPALREGLGRPADEVFAWLDENPISSASVARLSGATAVALFKNSIASGDNRVPATPGAHARHRRTASFAGIAAPSLSPAPQAGHCRIDGYTPCNRNNQYSK